VIRISQIATSAFMIYIFWFREAYGHNPLLLYGTVLVATVAALLDVIANHAKLSMNKILMMFCLFGAYSFITGLLISRNQSHFISMMATYFSFVIVCWDCFYISYRKQGIKWIMNMVLISSLLCALQTIFMGYGYQTEVLVTTMGPENNPHVLGYMMLLGIFSIVVDEKKIKQNFLIKIILIAVFLYVILLSGSRKSLLCAGVLMLYWIFYLLKTEKGFTIKKLLIILTLVIAAIIGAYYIITQYVHTEAFERLLLLFEQDDAVETRWLLYLEAFEFWKTNPIFGIGFGQFQIWSKYGFYSHSSYAEILCCTGILGILIFFVPIIKLAQKIIKRFRHNIYGYALCMLMLVLELLLGAGQIYIYSFSHLLCLVYLEMRSNELSSDTGTLKPT